MSLKNRIRLFCLSLASLLGLSRCQGQESFEAMTHSLYRYTVPLIKAPEIQQFKPSEIVLLDAREKAEYEVSHLAQARYLGYEQPNWQALQGLDKNQIIVVYCSVGYRSERMGETLQKRGFKRVYNLYGGIFDWVNRDLPVYRQGQKTQAVHPYNENWGKWLERGEKRYH